MLFNSVEFILLFLPVTFVIFTWLRQTQKHVVALAFLVGASLFFYAYWNWRMLPVLLVSMGANYWIAAQLRQASNRSLLFFGVAANVIALGYFKYANFFLQNAAGWIGPFESVNIVLPLGISFITFQKIAYLVDAYRGEVKQHTPVNFMLFVTFFPQLIAGPIVHHKDVMPQFTANTSVRLFESEYFSRGFLLFLGGLFKKVMIADQLAPYVDPAFANASQLNFLEAWTATLGYTLQLYFDFAGYSEMAMGLGLMFGIKLARNFDSPYKATSIQEFWRRWHITLGRFLRDYVYVSLGGNRNGASRAMLAALATMLLGGLWHGAGWTFVLWGGLHGVYLAAYLLWQKQPYRMSAAAARSITLLSVVFAWVLFRAASVDDAVYIWQTLIGLNGLVLPPGLANVFGNAGGVVSYAHSDLINGLEILLMVMLLSVTMSVRNIHEWLDSWQANARWGFAAWAAGSVALFHIAQPSVFLYFQF